MGDVLNEAYRIVQCKECPWYKQCVTPMKFTAEDLKRQMEQQNSPLGQSSGPMDMNMQNLLSSMANAAQNSMLEGCPVFIERIRTRPDLALKLKKLMQDWGNEEKKD